MQVEVVEKTAEELELEEAAKTAEERAAQEQALKEFSEGFTDTKVEPTEEEKKALEDKRLADEETAKAKEAEDLKHAPVTKSDPQFLDLVKKATSIEEIKQLVDKVRDTTNGKVGSLEQMIKRLQESTPTGQAITVKPEVFGNIHKEMPEHARMLAEGLTEVLKQFKGTAEPIQKETPAEFEARVNQTVDAREQARAKAKQDAEIAELDAEHPDWRTVVGPNGSETEFRKYVQEISPRYAKRVLSTDDSYILGEAITKFKEHQDALRKKPKIPPSTSRQDRLREAVPIRGGGTPPNTNREKTAEEQFADGFNS